MKSILPIFFFLLGSLLISCSDNSTKPEPEISEDPISGTYFLHGTKVKLRYDFPWPSWGGDVVILEADTTQTTMLVKVKLLEEKQDSVRFTGLEGVNAGEYQSINQDCTHPSCYGDAKLMNGELSFDLSGAGGLYRGTGTLENGKMTLNTHYEYRPTGIDYHLEGERIDE